MIGLPLSLVCFVHCKSLLRYTGWLNFINDSISHVLLLILVHVLELRSILLTSCPTEQSLLDERSVGDRSATNIAVFCSLQASYVILVG